MIEEVDGESDLSAISIMANIKLLDAGSTASRQHAPAMGGHLNSSVAPLLDFDKPVRFDMNTETISARKRPLSNRFNSTEKINSESKPKPFEGFHSHRSSNLSY